MRRPLPLLAALAACALVATAGCTNPNTAASQRPSTAAAAPAASAASAGPIDESKKMTIGFFGFARANSFASATFAGIEEYAGAHNASAEFIDPNFDAQTQVAQIQDAVTSGRFDVFIVQANDGTAVVPAVEAAVRAGITVVVEFTPVGTDYSTAEPQVDGTITLIDVPTYNGTVLGELGVAACQERKADPCQVAYLEGFKSLPLDNARTTSAVAALKADPSVQLVAQVEGGYTQEAGRKAMQDVLQANPDVQVVIGSSQAIAGAAQVPGTDDIAFIGNGGSRQAIDAVKSGDWYATYVLPERAGGAKAAELGLTAARGGTVAAANNETDLAPNGGRGTKDALTDYEGDYDE